MKYIIALLITTSLFFEARSQSFPLSQNLVQVNTKSPEAASLGKFGNVPVNYFTGIPSITIPVYEINVGHMSLPISLDYHAGGIRVDETSSSVGIGWALNGIGVISRNVVGRPDELQFGYIGAPNAVDVGFDDYAYLYDVRDGFKDAEPDIFQYNVNGLSGKFIFRNDGTIMQIPVTNNKITFVNGNFTITDPSGNVYLFEEKRTNFNDEGGGGYPPEYVNTWCITRMIGANSVDNINFSYEPGVFEVYETTTNFTASIGSKPDCNGTGGSVGISYSSITKNSVHYEYYPKEITWRGGKVSFVNVEDRQDVSGRGLRLDGIEVYSNQNGTSHLIKNTKFNQTYFYSPPPPGTEVSARNYRLRLDFVENLDVYSGAPIQVYRMDYNDTPLPPRGSYAQDQFGFNNGHTENPGLLQLQTVSHNGVSYTLGNANRLTDETEILAGTLSSIEYPTKGKTVFELEAHRFTAVPVGIGGGLRVKSITNYDVSGNFVNKEIYQYGTDGAGTMITPIFLQEINYETMIPRVGCRDCIYFTSNISQNTTIYRANSVHAVSQYGGSPIVYEKVTKTQVDSLGLPNGKTVYGSIVYTDNFLIPGNVGYSELRAGMYSISNAWKNGFLQYEEIYKSISAGYQLISKKVNNYSAQSTDSHNVLKVRSVYSHSGCELQGETYASGDFNLQVVPVYTGAMLLQSTISTSRDDNGNEIVSTQTFDYGSTPLLPSTIETSSSTGDVLTENLQYPLDLASGGNVYQKMVDRNMLSAVVQGQRLQNSNQISLVKINYYDWFGDSKLILPQSASEQVGTNPEEVRVLFNAYDTYGNILQQQKANDVYHTYIWGHNQSLPVAQVSNGVLKQATETVSNTLTIPTVQVPGVMNENYITIETGIDITFVQNVTLNCTVNRGGASTEVPDHYFNVTLSLFNEDTQSDVYNGAFGLTTQTSHTVSNLPVGKYTVRYRYDANVGTENAFNFNASLNYQTRKVYSTIFYTSFEEDIENINSEAHTGRQSHSGTYTVYLPKEIGEYILSYWTKEGSENWQHQEDIINVVSSTFQTRTIGAGGKLLDEVRLYPRTARMSTYTYDPLIGMTSVTDPNSTTTYYEYDGVNRLKVIKDSKGNILRTYTYHFKQ